MRIGHGYDVHKFAENRKLIIGGTEIPFELGLLNYGRTSRCCGSR